MPLSIVLHSICGSTMVPEGMVYIAGGEFVMGASEREMRSKTDLPQQWVEVREFYLDMTAVTNEQFRTFRKAKNYKTDSEKFGWSFVLELHATPRALEITNSTVQNAPHWLAVPGAYWRLPQGPGSTVTDRLDYPAVHISWNDAKAYCKWAGKRLPTETEWEAAVRKPWPNPPVAYPWGAEMPSNETEWKLNLWQGDFPRSDAALDGYSGVAPADAYEPSAAGLYNLLGNVWEWTSTYFAKSSGQRVLRGGSYLDTADASANHMVTCATRMGNTEDSASDNIGFRCAKDAEGAPSHRPRGYSYDQTKKKRPPPGMGDPIKDGGKQAEEMVQAIAAEKGVEGLQKWMDQQGMGTTVATAADAMKQREAAAAVRQEQMEAAMKQAQYDASFDDYSEEELKAEMAKEEL